ncbi:MAG: hypothetical protein MJ194_07550 [Clostridia bacterium]|nr:hypothetical protein [Clostridia bacterium]
MIYVNQLPHKGLPYITHTDEPDCERGKTTTFSSSGCGLASAMMVLDHLLVDPEFTMEDAVQLSYEAKANNLSGTNYARFAPAFAERFNLKYEASDDPERLRYCLRTGGAAVIHCKVRDGYSPVFTKGGHYICAIAEAEDGRIVILDPSYKEGKFDTPERKGKVEVKDGVFCLCEMQVLVEESLAKKPDCFHLFWRKW